ncbi:MAG: patatin-like phospholipase family protein [Spartobacteria bacterium]
MADDRDPAAQPRSVADVLAEELDGALGNAETQRLPLAEKQARLRAVYDRIHEEQPERSALCLSGGGIRSAIFGLGILQGLAQVDLLRKFDYLSTVSGGGYVGGWLSAWIKHHQKGAEGVADELRRRSDLTLNPEPAPIRHLRKFSNYLTPKTGFNSVDSWTLIATYIRNVFLNWLVLISWLAAAMMVPRLYLAAVTLAPNWSAVGEPATYAAVMQRWDIAMVALVVAAFALIAIAMAYAIIDVPSTGNARLSQSRFLKYRQLPLIISTLLLAEWWALFRNVHGKDPLRPGVLLFQFVVFSVATYLTGGFLASLVLWWRRGKPRSGHVAASLSRLAIILLTTALGGVCLWLFAMRVFLKPADQAVNYVCFAPALLLAVLLLVNFLFTGLASWLSEDQDREWWARSAAWILISICGWVVVNVIVLWGAQVITTTPTDKLAVFLGGVQANPVAKALLGTFGGMTGLVAALLALRSRFGAKLGMAHGGRWIMVLVALVFFVLLSVVISWLLLFLGSQPWTERLAGLILGSHYAYQKQLFGVFFLTAASLLFGIVMGFFINVNKFSLHAMYRSRLIRAFLAASRPAESRKPHLFTGFDPDDNMPLHDLRAGKPFHVINAALNLVKGEQLAWQERKAESFTMSRLHCGTWHLGYRPAEKYGDAISLGTALTISGAAASPNMGYHSSPIVGFLMTLFNVRLGWWLGNPGQPGAHTWERNGPRYAVGPLFSEAIGNTTDCYKYVNLSDGGHFDNLGLYEMVLRRCRYIMVIDVGQDSKYVFEDLGNAIRKIRIDLGVPINLKVVAPQKESEGTVNRCAYGTIQYSLVDEAKENGELVYIKPVIAGDEPPDVFNYAAAHPEFPHEPTTDQWFSESQLESYRLLGAHTMQAICGDEWVPESLPLFFARVKETLRKAEPDSG